MQDTFCDLKQGERCHLSEALMSSRAFTHFHSDTPRGVISTKTSIPNPLRLALKFLLLIIDHRGLLKCFFLYAFKRGAIL